MRSSRARPFGESPTTFLRRGKKWHNKRGGTETSEASCSQFRPGNPQRQNWIETQQAAQPFVQQGALRVALPISRAMMKIKFDAPPRRRSFDEKQLRKARPSSAATTHPPPKAPAPAPGVRFEGYPKPGNDGGEEETVKRKVDQKWANWNNVRVPMQAAQPAAGEEAPLFVSATVRRAFLTFSSTPPTNTN